MLRRRRAAAVRAARGFGPRCERRLFTAVCWNTGADPEEVGAAAASQLMEEVAQGGAIDAAHQPLALLLMAFGAQDVSRLRTGPLSPAAVSLLRGLDTFLGVRCHMTTEPADGSVLVSCRGVGFSNAAKSVI